MYFGILPHLFLASITRLLLVERRLCTNERVHFLVEGYWTPCHQMLLQVQIKEVFTKEYIFANILWCFLFIAIRKYSRAIKSNSFMTQPRLLRVSGESVQWRRDYTVHPPKFGSEYREWRRWNSAFPQMPLLFCVNIHIFGQNCTCIRPQWN